MEREAKGDPMAGKRNGTDGDNRLEISANSMREKGGNTNDGLLWQLPEPGQAKQKCRSD
jgi:hypothetical protein